MDGYKLRTFSGVEVDPFHLHLQDIQLVDIAHSLSMQCMLLGHCQQFMSIAEHCILLSERVEDKLKLRALLSWASCTYLPDINWLSCREVLRLVKEDIQRMIFIRFGIAQNDGKVFQPSEVLQEVEEELLAQECRFLQRSDGGFSGTFHCLVPAQAERKFLEAINACYN